MFSDGWSRSTDGLDTFTSNDITEISFRYDIIYSIDSEEYFVSSIILNLEGIVIYPVVM